MEYELRMECVSAESIGLPFAQSVVSITRSCWEKGAEPKVGTRYYVSDLECPARDSEQWPRMAKYFAGLSRGHWSIENKHHWKKDSEWGDDAPRQKQTKVARVLSLLRSGLLRYVREPLKEVFAQCQRHEGVAFKIVNSALKPHD